MTDKAIYFSLRVKRVTHEIRITVLSRKKRTPFGPFVTFELQLFLEIGCMPRTDSHIILMKNSVNEYDTRITNFELTSFDS